MVTLIFIDLETTGFSFRQDDIIDIGCWSSKGSFNSLVIPTRLISRRITAITNITNQMVRSRGVTTRVACQTLWSYLHAQGPFVLVGHNIHLFDMPFLLRLFHRLGLLSVLNRLACHGIVDTLHIFKKKHKHEYTSNKLGHLYEKIIGKKILSAHRAWNDAQALAEIWHSPWFQERHSWSNIEEEFVIDWSTVLDTYWERFIRLSNVVEHYGVCRICEGRISPYFRHFHPKPPKKKKTNSV